MNRHKFNSLAGGYQVALLFCLNPVSLTLLILFPSYRQTALDKGKAVMVVPVMDCLRETV
jgi:hypothetical protein